MSEPAFRSECLRAVGGGDYDPLQPREFHRRVGHQRPAAEVVGDDVGPGFAPLRGFRRGGADRLIKDGGADSDRLIRHSGGCAGGDHGFSVGVWIFEEQPGIRAHPVVGSDQERLAGLSHPDPGPVPVERHDPVQHRQRKLHRQHSGRPAHLADRSDDPGRGLIDRKVAGEVSGFDGVDVVGRHCPAIGVGQGALAAVGTGDDVGPEIHPLVRGVHHIAGGVEQEQIGVAGPFDETPEIVVIAGVRRRPGATVTGIVEAAPGDGIVGGNRVFRLQVLLGVGVGHERLDVNSAAAIGGAGESGGVVGVDGSGLRRGDGGVGESVESRGERTDRRDGGFVGGGVEHRVAHVGETAFDCLGLQLPDAGEPVEHRGAQRGSTGLEPDSAGRQCGQNAHRQDHEQQFGLDADPGEQAPAGPLLRFWYRHGL